MEHLIKVEDLCKIYNPGENEVRALDHINLEIDEGEFVAIIGQSGSGKSTFMNMLGCLDVPTSGKYYLNGTDVSTMTDNQLSEIRNREIGFIFQGFNLIPNLTAEENVELPLIYRGMDKKTRNKLATDALKMVGLEKRMSHRPNEMSGGQQQRVGQRIPGNGGTGKQNDPQTFGNVRRPAAACSYCQGYCGKASGNISR